MSDAPYIVLARKHRPRHFGDVVGQQHVAVTLGNALAQNRVAHALLFSGPRGVGKTSTARILSRALNCKEGPTATPCDVCGSCIEIAAGSSVDVIEIDAASNRGIDEIRELRDAVRYPPSRERYKVYIIDEVHMLTTPAFNALLKTLEEPPHHVVFVFATTEPHKIPDTILSRCQRYDFRRIPPDVIREHLSSVLAQEGASAEDEALRMIARQSEGCMRDAQSQLDQLISFSEGTITAELASRVLGVVGREALFRLTDALLARDIDTLIGCIGDAYRVGANLGQLTSDLLAHLRDLTICALTQDAEVLERFNPGERNLLVKQAQGTDVSVLHRMFAVLMEAAAEMGRTAHPRLLLEMTLIRMAAIEPVQPVGELVAKIEHLLGGGSLPDLLGKFPAARIPEPRTAVVVDDKAPVRTQNTPSVPRTPEASRAKRPSPITSQPSARVAEEKPATSPPPKPEPSKKVEAPRVQVEEPADPAVKAITAPSPGQPAKPSPSTEASSDKTTDQKRVVAPKPETPARGEDTAKAADGPELPPKLERIPDSHLEKWTMLVSAVRSTNPRLGELVRVAQIEPGSGVHFSLKLAGAQLDILGSPERLGAVNKIAKHLYGQDARVSLAQRDRETDSEHFSVRGAEQRLVDKERDRLRTVIKEHPATDLINDIFQPTAVRVTPRQVTLESLEEADS